MFHVYLIYFNTITPFPPYTIYWIQYTAYNLHICVQKLFYPRLLKVVIPQPGFRRYVLGVPQADAKGVACTVTQISINLSGKSIS